jgi:hypothetical protein
VGSIPEISRQLGLDASDIAKALAASRAKLLAARNKRPRCHLDDKILTSWNGLMISALARASQVLGEQRYLDAAQKSARFILSHLFDVSTRELLHRFRDGEARFKGQLDDYAFLVQALIDLYEASFNIDWLSTALSLTEQMNRLFYDQDDGGFFDTTGKDTSVLVRTKEWYDGAEPSGNSIAILNLIRLAHLTNNATYDRMARESLRHFSERLSEQPHATPQFLVALDMSLSRPVQIIIVGSSSDQSTRSLLAEVHFRFIPCKVLLLADGKEGQAFLSGHVPFLAKLAKINREPTAYVCEDFTCQLPTADPAMLARLLDALVAASN